MKKLELHHEALARGYIRVGETKEEPYKGRFGVGKKVYKHNPNSSRYCIVEYWTEGAALLRSFRKPKNG